MVASNKRIRAKAADWPREVVERVGWQAVLRERVGLGGPLGFPKAYNVVTTMKSVLWSFVKERNASEMPGEEKDQLKVIFRYLTQVLWEAICFKRDKGRTNKIIRKGCFAQIKSSACVNYLTIRWWLWWIPFGSLMVEGPVEAPSTTFPSSVSSNRLCNKKVSPTTQQRKSLPFNWKAQKKFHVDSKHWHKRGHGHVS